MKATPLSREEFLTGQWKSVNRVAGKNFDAVLRFLRGTPTSKIVMICPPPDAVEFHNGLPLSNKAAIEFHNLLLTETGLNTDKHFLVIPCSWLGLKPNKRSFQLAQEYFVKCASFGYVNAFVALGPAAFRQIFGDGLAGSPFTPWNTTYPKRVLNDEGMAVPVFSLPDPAALDIGDPKKFDREHFIKKQQCENWKNNFYKKAASFKEFYVRHSC